MLFFAKGNDSSFEMVEIEVWGLNWYLKQIINYLNRRAYLETESIYLETESIPLNREYKHWNREYTAYRESTFLH